MDNLRVVLNTRPLYQPKTGIGYYVENLYRGLSSRGDITVIPTIREERLKGLRLLGSLSKILRCLAGEQWLKVAIPAGEALIHLSRESVTRGDLYHETSYEQMPDVCSKKVANIYDLSFILYPELFRRDVLEVLQKGLRNILTADRFIVNTRAVKDEVISTLGIEEDRIDVIPLAPGGRYGKVNCEGKGCFVKKKIGREYILFVGEVQPRKNLAVLLKAYREIKERFDVRLVICGPLGWRSEELRSLVRDLRLQGDVVFTGYLDEEKVLHLYNHARVFVAPSLYEGFGMPLLEAMSCGVPVIASDIASFREVGADAVAYFNQNDHLDLAERLYNLLDSDSLNECLIDKGLRRSGLFNWQRVVDMTVESYVRCITS